MGANLPILHYLLSILTANTTSRLRFAPIRGSINSHTLDRVKANQSMSQLNQPEAKPVLSKVRKTTLHGLATQAQYIYQHKLDDLWLQPR